MRINYILETIGKNNLRDRSVRSFDKTEVTLGRGSDSDIFFTSRLVSFNHARLFFDQEKLCLESVDGKFGSTSVNGHPVQKSFLEDGDVIKLGSIVLKVSYVEEVWSLTETRMESLGNEEEKFRRSLAQMDIVKRLPPQWIIALAIILPVILIFGFTPYLGINLGVWGAGPLTDMHKFLENECSACHDNNFRQIKDTQCTQCHRIGDHVEFFSVDAHLSERCGFCHREHSGLGVVNRDDLIPDLRRDGMKVCLKCHANLAELNPKTDYPSMNGFDDSHPEFASVRQNWVDRAQLKLNHHYHLTAVTKEDKLTKANRLMQCNDCHVMDSAGKYMKPVTFEKFCVNCHKLKLRGAAHMLRTPHVKTSLVRTFLKSPKDFLYEYINTKPSSLLETPKAKGRRRRRGPSPQPIQKFKKEWVKKNFEKIKQQGGLLKNENEVYFSAQGGCIECHVLDIQPIGIFNPDSSQVALSLWSHSVRIWNTKTGKDEAHLKGHQDVVKTAVFSADGKWILTGSRDFTARLWKAPIGISPSFEGGENLPNSKEKQPLENVIEGIKNISPYEKLEIEPFMTFKKHAGAVNDAQFNPNLDKIITGSDDKTAIIWSLKDQIPTQVLSGHMASVIKVGFNQDGTLVYTLSANHTAKIWDAETGKITTDLKFSDQEISDLVFNPRQSNQLVAALSNGAIKIISSREGTVIHTFHESPNPLQKSSGHRLEVTSLGFNSDGSKLLSLSRDLTAKVWDLTTKKVTATLTVWDRKKEPPIAKIQMFLTAEFNRDGSQIITGSSDKMVRWWAADSGKLLKEKKGHDNEVTRVAFSSTGNHALSVAANNTAALWDMNSGTSIFFRHDDIEQQDIETELFPPETQPTQIPVRFFTKSFFSHKKHGFLLCENCHMGIKRSLLTSDMLTPSITPCRTCHEKEGVHLNSCTVCHYFHDEGDRGYEGNRIIPDHLAKLGFSFRSQQKPK